MSIIILLKNRKSLYTPPSKKNVVSKKKKVYTFRNTKVDKPMNPELKRMGFEFVSSYAYGLIGASKAKLFWKKVLPEFLFNFWFQPYADLYVLRRKHTPEIMPYVTNYQGHFDTSCADDMKFFHKHDEYQSPMWVLYSTVDGGKYGFHGSKKRGIKNV